MRCYYVKGMLWELWDHPILGNTDHLACTSGRGGAHAANSSYLLGVVIIKHTL